VLIDSPKPWCVNVDGALDEALLVEYEAPGACVCVCEAGSDRLNHVLISLRIGE